MPNVKPLFPYAMFTGRIPAGKTRLSTKVPLVSSATRRVCERDCCMRSAAQIRLLLTPSDVTNPAFDSRKQRTALLASPGKKALRMQLTAAWAAFAPAPAPSVAAASVADEDSTCADVPSCAFPLLLRNGTSICQNTTLRIIPSVGIDSYCVPSSNKRGWSMPVFVNRAHHTRHVFVRTCASSQMMPCLLARTS